MYDKSASFRCDERLFHRPGPAAENALSPKVLYVRVTTHVRQCLRHSLDTQSLHWSAPAYLTDELCQVADVEARQQLRSSSSSSLIVSCTRLLTVGDQAFPVTAARVLNILLDFVTSAPSVSVFWSRLQTHLFNISYPCDCTVPAHCPVTLVALFTIIILTYLLSILDCKVSTCIMNTMQSLGKLSISCYLY